MDSNMVSEVEVSTGADQGTVTENSQVSNGKTFTQDELNAIVARRIAAEQKKFDGIDIQEYRELKSLKERQETDRLMKREEFDKILKQSRERFDSEVQTLRTELQKVKVDGALQAAASKARALNPDHVAQLLKNSVRLDESGAVVVLNSDGEVRYNPDTAEQFSIDDLVAEFVNQNPYFRSAGPAGTGSTGNTTTQSKQSFDIGQLDLTRADHREQYRRLRLEGKI